MHQRPLTIIIIGWMLVIMAAFDFWQAFEVISLILNNDPRVNGLFAHHSLPINAQLGLLILQAAITLLSGLYILKGANWARMLWSIWCVVCIILNLIISPSQLVPMSSLVAEFLVILFLFLPGANQYFEGNP